MGKKCFIISPLGESEECRKMVSGIRDIVCPLMKQMGYDRVIDSSQINDPGNITSQIVEHILNDDMVVANLTGLNSNVMYELAIRHSTGKVCIHICKRGEKLPFDIKDYRTIFFEDSFAGVNQFRNEFLKMLTDIDYRKQYENPVLKNPYEYVLLSEKKKDVRLDLGDTEPFSDNEGTFYITKENETASVDYRNRLVLIAYAKSSYSYVTEKQVDISKYKELVVQIEHLLSFHIMFICLIKENGEKMIFQVNNPEESVRIDVSKISGMVKIEVGITAGKSTAISQIKAIYFE